MSTTFNLTNTATEVNTALQAVVGADTTPDGASANMVTSQGVFNHVVTELGPFKGKTLTTESTGIAATDNDTSVPTCAAVNDAIANVNTANFVAIYQRTANGGSNSPVVVPVTETSDPNNIGSVSSGTVTLGSGTYAVSYAGDFHEDDNSTPEVGKIELRHNGKSINTNTINETGTANFGNTYLYESTGGSGIVSSASSQTVAIYIEHTDDKTVLYQNVKLTIVKLA